MNLALATLIVLLAPDPSHAAAPSAPASDIEGLEQEGATPIDPPMPPVVPVAITDVPPDDDNDWYQELDVDAFLSAAYVHNFGFTNPTGVNVGRQFDRNNDSFKLDLATLTVQWKARSPGDAGFRLDISHGMVVPAVIGGNDVALLQAYARYLIPIGSGLSFDFGTFLTHIGSETVEGFETSNATYTHGFIFTLLTPPTMTGLRLAYDWDHTVQFTAWLTNGWRANVLDGNGAKTVGAQLNITPNEDLKLSFSYLGGAEQPGNNHNWRQMINAYVDVHPDEIFTARVEGTYGHEANSGGPATDWWGVAALLQAQTDVFGIAARGEYVDNTDGFQNIGARLVEWTISPSVRLHEAFLLRADVRQDRALDNVPLFNGPAGGSPTTPGSSQQTTLSLNAILAY